MKLEYSVRSAAGPKFSDCHFIALRWDPKDEENACESFVMQVKESHIYSVIGTLGYYKDLWRSPSGTVFVGGGRTVHRSANPVQGGGEWIDETGVTSYGLWGFDDDFVLGYGDPLGKKLHLFDGSTWRELAAPGLVMDVHGTRPELLFAAGNHGIARYDGDGWERIATGVARPFNAIHVVSEDEMYAIMDREQVWAGSLDGWSPVTKMRDHKCLTSIVKWMGRIWVGDSHSGLSVLEEGRLTVVKPKLRPRSLHAGEHLLVTHDNGLSRSENSESFGGFKLGAVANVLREQKPVWLESRAAD